MVEPTELSVKQLLRAVKTLKDERDHWKAQYETAEVCIGGLRERAAELEAALGETSDELDRGPGDPRVDELSAQVQQLRRQVDQITSALSVFGSFAPAIGG